jgi:peptide subunit release factor 1 (eRF1)
MEVAMFTDNDLRELLDFVAAEPVLSLYLSTDPSEGNADAYRLRLKTLLKEVHLPQDSSAVEQYFGHEYDWSGRAVAVFSCVGKNFFRAYPLAVPMRNLVQVNDRPSVKPLADLLDNYGGYGVVLVDKQGARAFYFHMGELREHEGVLGETVKHVKRGGASSFPGRRGGIAGRTDHMDEVVDRNMKEAVDFAVHFFEENHVRRVLIGGSDDNTALFKGQLPKAWQSLVMGTFTMAMTASNQEVRERALRMGVDAALKIEADLVDELVTGASKLNGAVAGMADTYDAINHDRVKTLVFMEDLKKEGFVCNHCGALYHTKTDDTCPLCGEGKLERTLDGIELAVNAVMRRGGEVSVVRPHPVLQNYEGIGAILRY